MQLSVVRLSLPPIVCLPVSLVFFPSVMQSAVFDTVYIFKLTRQRAARDQRRRCDLRYED